MARLSRCLAMLALLALFWTPQAHAGSTPCGERVRCEVPTGYYLVHVPSGWDGRSPLPAVVFLHGWMGSAEDVIGNADFVRFADRVGLLLVAPNGEGRTWSFPGSPGHYRDEIAFMGAVLDDLERRFPVERRRLWASGFSQGGSMVWYLACEMGSRFAAFAPVAGAFWTPMPASCPSGPVNMRHVHGLADRTVPMQGRALRGGTYRQADVRQSLDVIRRTDGCAQDVVAEPGEDGTRCERYARCSSGRSLQLCLHDGDHMVDIRFLEAAWDWINSLPKGK